MTTHVPVVLGGSTRGVSIRTQRAELRRLEKAALGRELSRDEKNRLGVLRERERLRAFKAKKRAVPKRLSQAQQITELLRLEALQRERALTPDESERIGELVMLEQQRARYRPARIIRLRAELALLETLEMAERGAVAEGCATAEPLDLSQGDDGNWAVPLRAVA